MKAISLAAVDLDGTLLMSEGVLAPRGAALLRHTARGGVRVVLATTRNFSARACDGPDSTLTLLPLS